MNTPTQLALGIAITLAVIAAARLNPLRVLESIHPILILLVLMGVVNLFVVRTGTPVVALGPLSITDQGVTIAVLYACRFALVIILGAVFLTTTTPTAMTDAFATLISPLNRLGIHAQEIALVMSLALRFIPTLTDETRAIVDAQSRAWRFHRNRFTGPAHQGDERDYRADFRRHVASRGQPEPRT